MSADSFQSAASELGKESAQGDADLSSDNDSLDLRAHTQTESEILAAGERPASASRDDVFDEGDVLIPERPASDDEAATSVSGSDSEQIPSSYVPSASVSPSSPLTVGSGMFPGSPINANSSSVHELEDFTADPPFPSKHRFLRSTPVGHSMRSNDGIETIRDEAASADLEKGARRVRSQEKPPPPPPPRRKFRSTATREQRAADSTTHEQNMSQRDADAVVVHQLFERFYGVPQSRPPLQARSAPAKERRAFVSALLSAGTRRGHTRCRKR